MDWLLFAVLAFIISFTNRLVASWLYHRRVKKSREQFLAHLQLKFPDATITFRTVAASDLKALQMIEAELDDIPPHRPSTAPPKGAPPKKD